MYTCLQARCPMLRYCSNELISHMQKPNRDMFIVTSFRMGSTRKQPKCPLVEEKTK